MPYTTKSGEVKQINLLMALADFMWACRHLASHPKPDQPEQPDAGFEIAFRLLTTQIREWWGDYKKDWPNYWP